MTAKDYLQHWYQQYHNSVDEWLHSGLILVDQEGQHFTLSDYKQFCAKFNSNHGDVFKYAQGHQIKLGTHKVDYLRQDIYYYAKFKLVAEYTQEDLMISLYNIKLNCNNSVEIDNPDVWD